MNDEYGNRKLIDILMLDTEDRVIEMAKWLLDRAASDYQNKLYFEAQELWSWLSERNYGSGIQEQCQSMLRYMERNEKAKE